jgi:rhodanese-related sulfurtransferase
MPTSPSRNAKLLSAARATALLAGALFSLVAAACGYDGPMLSVQELKSGLDDPSRKINVVDVRPPSQYAKGHVPGAINLPLEQLDEKAGTITALDGEVAVICNCGKGALAAAKKLRDSGISVTLVEGGYKKWTAAGYQLSKNVK